MKLGPININVGGLPDVQGVASKIGDTAKKAFSRDDDDDKQPQRHENKRESKHERDRDQGESFGDKAKEAGKNFAEGVKGFGSKIKKGFERLTGQDDDDRDDKSAKNEKHGRAEKNHRDHDEPQKGEGFGGKMKNLGHNIGEGAKEFGGNVKKAASRFTDLDGDGKHLEFAEMGEKALNKVKEAASHLRGSMKMERDDSPEKGQTVAQENKRGLWDRMTDLDGDGKRFEPFSNAFAKGKDAIENLKEHGGQVKDKAVELAQNHIPNGKGQEHAQGHGHKGGGGRA